MISWVKRPTWDLALGCDFSTGAARDRSQYANTLTLANGATVTDVLVLDGTNDMLTAPDGLGLDLPGAFTVSAWVEPSSPGSSVRGIAGRYLASGTSRSWYFAWRYDLAGTPVQGTVYLDGGSTNVADYQFATTLPTSGWHHAAMVFDSSASAGSRIRAFIDGVEITVSTIGREAAYTPFDTGLITTIGAIGSVASPVGQWKGNMGPVAIFRRALSAQEIHGIYVEGRS